MSKILTNSQGKVLTSSLGKVLTAYEVDPNWLSALGVSSGMSLYTTDIQASVAGDCFYVSYSSFGATTIGSQSSPGGALLARMALDGVTCQWLATFTSSTSDAFTTSIASSFSSVFVAGAFSGTLEIGAHSLVATGVRDIFVARLNAATGACEWLVGSSAATGNPLGGPFGNTLSYHTTTGDLFLVSGISGAPGQSVQFGATTITNADRGFIARFNSTTGAFISYKSFPAGVAGVGGFVGTNTAPRFAIAGILSATTTLGSTTIPISSGYGGFEGTYLWDTDTWAWAAGVDQYYAFSRLLQSGYQFTSYEYYWGAPTIRGTVMNNALQGRGAGLAVTNTSTGALDWMTSIAGNGEAYLFDVAWAGGAKVFFIGCGWGTLSFGDDLVHSTGATSNQLFIAYADWATKTWLGVKNLPGNSSVGALAVPAHICLAGGKLAIAADYGSTVTVGEAVLTGSNDGFIATHSSTAW